MSTFWDNVKFYFAKTGNKYIDVPARHIEIGRMFVKEMKRIGRGSVVRGIRIHRTALRDAGKKYTKIYQLVRKMENAMFRNAIMNNPKLAMTLITRLMVDYDIHDLDSRSEILLELKTDLVEPAMSHELFSAVKGLSFRRAKPLCKCVTECDDLYTTKCEEFADSGMELEKTYGLDQPESESESESESE
jgi:hypothetical protein